MARLLRVIVSLIAALTLVIGIAPGTASASTASAESEFVAHINSLRASKGLAPLQVHPHLVSVARSWAQTMANAGDIWHNPNVAADVERGVPNWQRVGENVGVGPSVGVLHQAFVDSPGHYKNLVDGRFTYIGVGVVMGADGNMYTAHQFLTLMDAPAPAPAPKPVATQAAAPSAASYSPPPIPVVDPEASPGITSVPAVLESLRALEGLR